MIKRLVLVVSGIIVLGNTAAAQEMYFSLSGSTSTILSGDSRHQYDIWIKPENGAPSGNIQVYDAGLGGAVDLITMGEANTTTKFATYNFSDLYRISGSTLQEQSNSAVPVNELTALAEERFKNRWVTLNPVNAAGNSNGYIIRVSADDGDDVNSFNIRVVGQDGRVLSGSSWKIIAVDLSIGLYDSNPSKVYQLRPYHLGSGSQPNLITAGQEDSRVRKIDSFGDTYDLSGVTVPPSKYGITNKWGLSITGSRDRLNTLTVYGADSPVLWLYEPIATDQIAKPDLQFSETPSARCTEKSFEITGNSFSSFDLNSAQWIRNNQQLATGASPKINFQTSGITPVDILIPNEKTHFPEYWAYRQEIFVNTPPIARLETPKEIISPSEPVVLSAEKSYDLEGRPVSFSWFVNGALRGNSPTFRFSSTVSGTYIISVRVSDGGNLPTCSIDQKQVMIRVNTQPYSEISLQPVIGTGEQVVIKAINQSDADNDSLSYRWTGDGISGAATGDSVQVSHTEPGIYSVNLTIDDGTGSNNSTYSVSESYEVNAAPVPSFTLAEKAAPGDLISLNAGQSSDPNADQLSYSWYINDRLVAEAPVTEYSFNDPGDYDIRLVVDDGRGVSNSTQELSRSIHINAAPNPVITAVDMTSVSKVSFSAEQSTDAESELTSFSWDFGDGNRATGPNVEHFYRRTGTYRVTLTVNDGEGLANSSQTTEHIVVINQFPEADFVLPAVAAPGEAFSVDGSLSSDPDGSITNYEWYADGKLVANGPQAEITFNEVGTHDVTLVVKDDSGYELAQGILNKLIRVNAPPVPKWKTDPDRLVPDTEIIFTAADSYDPDGEIKNYLWSFEDGVELQGRQIQRIFTESGPQRFTLTVDDGEGLSNSTVSVEGVTNVNHQPYIVTEPVVRSNSLKVTLDASASYDLDNNPMKFEWTLPDGSKRTEASFSWTAPEPGVHIIGLTVDDGLGLSNSKNTESIRVLVNRPVQAVVESEIASCTGQTVLFNSSRSFDPDGDPFSVRWDFGNGTSSDEANPSYVYEEPGIYEAKLTLDDGFSEQKTVTKIPVIIEGSPVAKLNISDTTICVNSRIRFDGSASTDPSGALPSFSWDTGDGNVKTGPVIDHVFTEPGIYTVSLTVEGSGSGRCSNVSQTTATVRVIEGPEAEFELPEYAVPGETITLDGSASSADGGIKTARWIIDSENGQQVVNGLSNSFRFDEPGEYFVTLELETNSETSCNTVSLTKSVKVNAPPVISWELPQNIPAGTDLKLDALASTDPDGYIKEYKWYLDDGFVSSNAAEIIKAIQPGEHTVTLEVTDNSSAGNRTVVEEKTFFANSAPSPTIVAPEEVYLNQTVSFQSGLARDADNDILSSTWKVNGEVVPTPTFRAESLEGYTVTLIQDDGRGLPNSVDSAVVEFTPLPLPVAKPDYPERIVVGATLTTADIGLSGEWKFKNQAIYEDRWIAYSQGRASIQLAWVPEGQELTSQSFPIEVVPPLQFTEATPARRMVWNPANPGVILTAPAVNREAHEVEYVWKQRGEVIGTGPRLGANLIRGENRFTVEVRDKQVAGSVPIEVDLVIVTE